MYESLIHKVETYFNVVRVLSKFYLHISLLPPSKLYDNLIGVKLSFQKGNQSYDILIKRHLLYYDIPPVIFGIGSLTPINSVSYIYTIF